MLVCRGGHCWIGTGSGKSRFKGIDREEERAVMENHKSSSIQLFIAPVNIECISAGYIKTEPKMLFGDILHSFTSHLKKIKVIHLIAVLHDVALNLARVDPSNEILHVASDQESGIIDDFGSNANMTLFNECSSLVTLVRHSSVQKEINSNLQP